MQNRPTGGCENPRVLRLESGAGFARLEAVLSLLLPLTRFKALLLTNAALQVVDGYVTLVGTGRGFVEGNPLVGAVMKGIGPAGGILLVKLLAFALLYVLYRRRHHPIVEPGLAYVAVVYTLMAVLPWTVLLAGT